MDLRAAPLWSAVAMAACGTGASMSADLTADVLRAAPTERRQHDATWTLEAELALVPADHDRAG